LAYLFIFAESYKFNPLPVIASTLNVFKPIELQFGLVKR